jgi:uncharacterized protein (DUF2249 family)
MSKDESPVADVGDDEDVRILWQATARADALMADLARGRDTDGDLASFLGFLREVVLARITDEDRHILPALRAQAGSETVLQELAQQHLQLRSDIEDLASAAQDEPAREERARMVRRLLRHLEAHLAAEASLLHTVNADRQWVAANHWFALTEGPVIDVDALRPDQADGAVLNRLTRLAPCERLELRGTRDPHPLWLRLQQRDPGGYSWEATQDDVSGWSVQVMRRATT